MIIICGRTIAEVEHDLEMAKAAIATGAPMGIGGATMADVEQALRGLRQAVISNPNYVGVPPIEDEICPECGADWDGDFCEECGYDLCDCDCDCECVDTELEDEDEEDEELSADDLTAEDVDRITAQYGLPKVWATVMKSVLGL